MAASSSLALQLKEGEEYFPRRVYGVVLRKGKLISPQAKQFIEVMDPNLKDRL